MYNLHKFGVYFISMTVWLIRNVVLRSKHHAARPSSVTLMFLITALYAWLYCCHHKHFIACGHNGRSSYHWESTGMAGQKIAAPVNDGWTGLYNISLGCTLQHGDLFCAELPDGACIGSSSGNLTIKRQEQCNFFTNVDQCAHVAVGCG